MFEWYDIDGKGITTDEWVRRYTHIESRRIGLTVLPSGRKVSTVLLGLTHGTDEHGKPLIFETMIFEVESFMDSDCDRYATKEEARAGHIQMCAKWLVRETTRDSLLERWQSIGENDLEMARAILDASVSILEANRGL